MGNQIGNPPATSLANQTNDAKLSAKNNSSSANINYNQVMDNFHALHSRKSPNASTFKALDFSDAAIYGKGDEVGKATTEDEKFRHFHQMRIFIQNGRSIKHGADSHEQTMIVCNLPEQIQYSLNSKWGNPIKFGDEGLFNLLMQVGSEKLGMGGTAPSGTLRASTLRIWQNTDPLTLNLQIPVIDDGASVSGTNLVEALEILGSLVLPRKNENAFFYTPPPSPLNININYSSLNPYKDREERPLNLHTNNYARIMVQLGGVLLIDNCIIESLTVQYPNTKAQILHDYSKIEGDKPDFGTTGHKYLHPLLAVVNLKISTLEALTANTYSNMLWAKPQSGEGYYHGDITPLTDGIREATQWLLDVEHDENGKVKKE